MATSTPRQRRRRLPLLLSLYLTMRVAFAAANAAAELMPLVVLQYNIFGRPYEVSTDGQSERLARIPASLLALAPDLDVVTFAEADIGPDREAMLAQFRSRGFPHATTILHDPDPFTSLLNGGVLVVSRWPIVREAQHVYRGACHYSDCLAAKGVKYARILKTSPETQATKVFNIFATHMQAWSTPEGRADRVLQAQQMRAFVDALQLSTHEPLIFAGDFNVDNNTFVDEVEHLIALLGAHAPVRVGEQLFTSDPRSNILVGRDGAANSNKCSGQYIESWGPEKNGTFYPSALTRLQCNSGVGTALRTPVFINPDMMCYCPCCPKEWLDYVLYAKAPYQQPATPPTLESIVNQVAPFTAGWSAPQGSGLHMELVDLSDHFPVLGRFHFAVDPRPGHDDDPRTVHLDGCSTDDDCHFRAFRCYCRGPGCFFEGNHTSGWDLDSQHPVNRNCLYQKTSFKCLCGPN